MKIEGNSNVVINLYKQNAIKATSSNNNIKGSDRVELSKASKEISKYIEEYKDTELINEKVAEIKEKITQGTYKINETELAKSMVQSIKRGV